MQQVSDAQFKEIAVSILEMCYCSLVQDMIADFSHDLFALQRYIANFIPSNRMLFLTTAMYTERLCKLKGECSNSLGLAMVCMNALDEIDAVTLGEAQTDNNRQVTVSEVANQQIFA